MMDAREFLSCDWGSTSFRLRRVRGASEVIHEISRPAGVRTLYEEALRNGLSGEAGRSRLFESFLREQIAALFANTAPPSRPLPLIVSGMASSSIGWRELPYAKVPFPLDGSGLVTSPVDWEAPREISITRLVSGVATGSEMMRGEETEILGLMAGENMASCRERCLLILPGTHSKHVLVEKGAVVDWRTFMTGELYEVLRAHSLLRASVDVREPGPLLPHRTAFQNGVRLARERGLAGALFCVRTRAVLGGRPAAENTWFLSGLLIGAELEGIHANVRKRTIVLAATARLAEPYGSAFEALGIPVHDWLAIPPDDVERAVIRAHAAMCFTARE